jgi:hypothetical protein
LASNKGRFVSIRRASSLIWPCASSPSSVKNRVGFSINLYRSGACVFQCRIACAPYLFTFCSLHTGQGFGGFADLLVGGLFGQPPQVELQLTGRRFSAPASGHELSPPPHSGRCRDCPWPTLSVTVR